MVLEFLVVHLYMQHRKTTGRRQYWGVIPDAPYSHHFETGLVCPQDVFTSCSHYSTLSHLITCLHVLEPLALMEVEYEVHQPKLHQQVGNLLDSWFLVLANVGAEVPYHCGIIFLEACQGLLQVY